VPAALARIIPQTEGKINGMSHEQTASHGSGKATLPFTPTEVEAFHTQDKHAATAIVGLMVGIFVLGVVLYLGVCVLAS
jgi:hypothetical protein